MIRKRKRLSDQVMPKLEFYFAPGPSSMAPHIALHEVGVAVRSRPISFATRPRQREPAYLAINPEGKVPALLDRRPAADRSRGDPVLSRRTFPGRGAVPAGHRSRGAGRLLDVVHRRDRASGARQGLDHAEGRSRSRTRGWARANGRSAATRSPTSICSACTGASVTHEARAGHVSEPRPRTTHA